MEAHEFVVADESTPDDVYCETCGMPPSQSHRPAAEPEFYTGLRVTDPPPWMTMTNQERFEHRADGILEDLHGVGTLRETAKKLLVDALTKAYQDGLRAAYRTLGDD